MKSLLGVEWLKIKGYRTFWVLIGFFLLLLPLWNYAISNGIIKMGGRGINLLSQAYSFPDVWGNMGWWGSVFIIFISILVIILTTNEYSFRTNRQNVIDGWTRLEFYHSKVLLVLLLSVFCTAYLFIVGVLFGMANGGYLSDVFSHFEQVGYFFLLSVDYLGLALLIAIWIRKSGLAIGLFLLYTLIIETILKFTINWKLDFKLGNFLPLQSSDELLPFPLMKMARAMLTKEAVIPELDYVIVTILWCSIYYFAGRRTLLKSDW